MWYASPEIGLNSYKTMPYAAIGMELVFAWVCLAYLQFKRRDLDFSRRKWTLLYAFFTVSILLWMPAARIPMRQWLGL